MVIGIIPHFTIRSDVHGMEKTLTGLFTYVINNIGYNRPILVQEEQ
jgi:hypothetical protein